MSRPTGVFKKTNEYQRLISGEMYEKTPKAVFAAIAVSFMLNHQGILPENMDAELKNEWKLLYDQDIIPQKPF